MAQASTGEETGEKTFILGDTTFNAENDEATIDPHQGYSGWAAIRYGVGETLFRFSDDMELEPWLATGYERVDALTWKITLRDAVVFSNGRKMDGAAVKACLEDLVAVHDRAAGDLQIAAIEAAGQTVTIRTATPNPSLLNHLADPYACIIDVAAGNAGGMVVGTGPFVATELVTDDHLLLQKNPLYWDGPVQLDRVEVLTITDGDTLALALRSGEIDAAYGMAYANYPLFENGNFHISTATTSRAFFLQMNFRSALIQDPAVRKAIAMGIDKESFVKVLLRGYGETAQGPLPDSFVGELLAHELAASESGANAAGTRGAAVSRAHPDVNQAVSKGESPEEAPSETGVVENTDKAEQLSASGTSDYDPKGAKRLLEQAGWIDTDGDGIREKDGVPLRIRWLTYPSRQELPILAEAAQAQLRDIGIDVELNITPSHNTIVSDPTAWDVYAAAFVTMPTGDPSYFYTTHCLDSSVKNRGAYHSDRLEALSTRMNQTFDPTARLAIAAQMQQQIQEDNAFVFCSFLRMSLISRSNITGFTAHPCDYYELTANVSRGQVP